MEPNVIFAFLLTSWYDKKTSKALALFKQQNQFSNLDFYNNENDTNFL